MMGGMLRRIRVGAKRVCVLLFLVLLVPSVARPAEPVPEVTLTLTPPALLRLLQTVMPYRLEVGNSLLKETLTFSNPRNVVLSNNQVIFTLRVQGKPFPLDQDLKPVLALKKTADGNYQVVVASLPVAIPGYGSLDLSEVFPPVSLQSLFEQKFELQDRALRADLKIQDIQVGREQIEMAAILRLIPLRTP